VCRRDNGPFFPTPRGAALIQRREIRVLGAHGRMGELGEDCPSEAIALAGVAGALFSCTFVAAWRHACPCCKLGRSAKPRPSNADLRHHSFRSALVYPRNRAQEFDGARKSERWGDLWR
jgi:hypothetical protein